MRLEYLLFRDCETFLIVAFFNFHYLALLNEKCKPARQAFGSGLQKQIRSSAWLEHYTDNVGVSSSNLLGSTVVTIASAMDTWSLILAIKLTASAKASAVEGGLAQLARALALQAKGHRFDSDILHQTLADSFIANVEFYSSFKLWCWWSANDRSGNRIPNISFFNRLIGIFAS